MFTIYGNRKSFFQWDLNQKLIVNSPICSEVHFSNILSNEALVCRAYKLDGMIVVDVPNILLTEALDIKAYIVAEDEQGCRTCNTGTFEVVKRDKPADYVYTETEVKSFDDLEQRVKYIEDNGASEEQIAQAVEGYLAENPIEVPTKVSQLENDMGYLDNNDYTEMVEYVSEEMYLLRELAWDLDDRVMTIEGDYLSSTYLDERLEGYATQGYVDEALNNLPNYATEDFVYSLFNGYVTEVAALVGGNA